MSYHNSTVVYQIMVHSPPGTFMVVSETVVHNLNVLTIQEASNNESILVQNPQRIEEIVSKNMNGACTSLHHCTSYI